MSLVTSKNFRAERERLLDLFDRAVATGTSVQQIEADDARQPDPIGLISEFGYDPITDPDKPCIVLTWDADAENAREVKNRGDSWRARRRAIIAGANRVQLVSRQFIIDRDDSTCYLCGKICEPGEIHLDHVVPLARGGDHTADNLRVACAPCNLSKGARLIAA